MRNIFIFILLLMVNLKAVDDKNSVFTGYIRGTYHTHDIKNDKFYKDDAIGGTLHYETSSVEGFSLGASLYAVSKVFNDDNNPLIRLRGENSKSYALLGELYVQGELGTTTFKIGRQELNTPFADMDDVGMVPNTFEALSLVNKDIENLEIFLGQINKMSGVDAEVVDKFTKINGSDNMQLLGFTYDGFKEINLDAWYNRLKNAEIDEILYLESSYANKIDNYDYIIAVQYAKQSYLSQENAKIWGAKLDIGLEWMGLLFNASYNKVSHNVASSGFGGGPFFTGSEFLVLDNAGADANTKRFAMEYDVSTLGLKGLVLALSKMYLETSAKKESSEVDLTLSYELGEDTKIHATYAKINGVNLGLDDATHVHIYVNYHF